MQIFKFVRLFAGLIFFYPCLSHAYCTPLNPYSCSAEEKRQELGDRQRADDPASYPVYKKKLVAVYRDASGRSLNLILDSEYNAIWVTLDDPSSPTNGRGLGWLRHFKARGYSRFDVTKLPNGNFDVKEWNDESKSFLKNEAEFVRVSNRR